MFSFLKSSSLVKNNLLILVVCHFVLDFFTGIWPIYKTIAGIDMAKAGLIAGITGFIGEALQLFFGTAQSDFWLRNNTYRFLSYRANRQ